LEIFHKYSFLNLNWDSVNFQTYETQITVEISDKELAAGAWNQSGLLFNPLNEVYMVEKIQEYCAAILFDLDHKLSSDLQQTVSDIEDQNNKLKSISDMIVKRDKSVLFQLMSSFNYLKLNTKFPYTIKVEVG
jgi:predicted DNA binding CopG/RHH family protein